MTAGRPLGGRVHLPDWVDGAWVKQALDCRIYARAAASIAGADRWPERKSAEMERELGVKAPTLAAETAAPARAEREAAERPAQQSSGRSDWLEGRQRNWFSQ